MNESSQCGQQRRKMRRGVIAATNKKYTHTNTILKRIPFTKKWKPNPRCQQHQTTTTTTKNYFLLAIETIGLLTIITDSE
jgi:hypothetical protein